MVTRRELGVVARRRSSRQGLVTSRPRWEMGDIASRITGVSAASTGTVAAGLAQQRRAEPPMSGGDYAPSSGECATGRPGDPGPGRADEQRERGHRAQRNAHGDADQGARATGEPDRRRRSTRRRGARVEDAATVA